MNAAGTVQGKNPHTAIGATATIRIENSSHQLKDQNDESRKLSGTRRGGSASRSTVVGVGGSP